MTAFVVGYEPRSGVSVDEFHRVIEPIANNRRVLNQLWIVDYDGNTSALLGEIRRHIRDQDFVFVVPIGQDFEFSELYPSKLDLCNFLQDVL